MMTGLMVKAQPFNLIVLLKIGLMLLIRAWEKGGWSIFFPKKGKLSLLQN